MAVPFIRIGLERGEKAIYIADDGAEAESLVKHADMAMYHVKTAGRNGYAFFSPDMNAAFHHKVALESDLRRALDQGELELRYQPQVNVSRRIDREQVIEGQPVPATITVSCGPLGIPGGVIHDPVLSEPLAIRGARKSSVARAMTSTK